MVTASNHFVGSRLQCFVNRLSHGGLIKVFQYTLEITTWIRLLHCMLYFGLFSQPVTVVILSKESECYFCLWEIVFIITPYQLSYDLFSMAPYQLSYDLFIAWYHINYHWNKGKKSWVLELSLETKLNGKDINTICLQPFQ